jgi:glycogen debranching enzyme
MKRLMPLLFLWAGTVWGSAAWAQQAPAALAPLPAFPVTSPDLPRISQATAAIKPFSVIGPRGAILGQQNGEYEAWVFPWKVFSGMRMTVEMQDYPVPIDVNEHAAWIDVQPHATTLTYAHANFTIRQIMIAPKDATSEDGPLLLYQFEAVRPMTITFSLHPVMQRMWPAESDDMPSPEWVKTGERSGYYVLHLNFPENAAGLAMPDAEPGILAPYQERARSWPLQFVLHFDPKRDAGKLYPLLMVFGTTAETASNAALGASLARLDASARQLVEANAAYYRSLLGTHTSIETPDPRLNAAFAWGIAAIDQLRVKTTPDLREEALTAGFVGSGDAARPGFGWFFGRDALWTLYAVNSYGDFETTKQEIEFLLKRQRADGKIMHEWSQTANLVDWKATPYEYASSDATLLLQMAMNDYLNITGDADYVASKWEPLLRAWQYETSHDSSDGIYNNSSGSGWVESWIPAMPQQEVDLALLDEEASRAFANLARAAHHEDVAAQAEQRAARIQGTIEREYYLPKTGFYAFSHNSDGTVDATPTIFPAVGWWDAGAELEHPEGMMARWASSEFSTDWGSRILSDTVRFYDPISYHQGSVWPLFTGWLAMAEYRGGHPLAGYAALMQNANLTWSQDPGSVTELLSGEFYQVLGRSTAHQLWSSAMVISPILRGLFGIEWDEPHHELRVTPHLPADWETATVRRIPFGEDHVDLTFQREEGLLLVTAVGVGAELHLSSRIPGAKAGVNALQIPLPAIEASTSNELPPFGAGTQQLKVLGEEYAGRSYTLRLAAPGGSTQSLRLRENAPRLQLHVEGAIAGDVQAGMRSFSVPFPAGTGYVEKTVRISW